MTGAEEFKLKFRTEYICLKCGFIEKRYHKSCPKCGGPMTPLNPFFSTIVEYLDVQAN